jgi:phosphoglycolate phosphatase
MKTGMALRGILFDLDGTLIDSLADLGNAVNRALVESGFPPHPLDAYRQFVGDGMRQLVERAMPEQARAEVGRVDALLGLYQRHYEASWRELTRPYPGVEETLDWLAGTGAALGVISNKRHDFTTKCTAHFFPETPFQVVMGARDGLARKPDPEPGTVALEELGLKAGECVYVGDSGLDMEFARAVGMTPLGAAWGFRGEAELRGAGAREIAASAEDLKEKLTALGVAGSPIAFPI